MTILEALKERKAILKRINKNRELVQQYAAQPGNEKPLYGSEERQTRELEALTQSSEDLAERYNELGARVAYTNLMTFISLEGEQRSLHELLEWKRKLVTTLKPVYEAMNDNTARAKLRMGTGDHGIARFWSEDAKNKRLRELDEFYEAIDSRLEVVNATTELLELPLQK